MVSRDCLCVVTLTSVGFVLAMGSEIPHSNSFLKIGPFLVFIVGGVHIFKKHTEKNFIMNHKK